MVNNQPTHDFRIWRLPNDLALDAALAAVVWHWAFARALDFPASLASLAVLGLSVWLVYMGDRWLDALGRSAHQLPTQRHRFAARHRKTIPFVWLGLLVVDVVLAVKGLTNEEFLAGLVLLAASVLYTIGVQRRLPRRWTKEAQVALIFSAGVGAFFVGHAMNDAQAAVLMGSLAVFALVCFINCALLARWEIEADRAMGRSSLALALGNSAGSLRHGAELIVVIAMVCIVYLPASLMLGLGLYGGGLWAIDYWQFPLDPEDRRCVVDGLLVLLGVVAGLAG